MNDLSPHTYLVNHVIALGKKNPVISASLLNVGYALESVGMRFEIRSGAKVRPDVSFRSDVKNTILLAECKTGGLEDKQAKNFQTITAEDVSTQNITGLNATELKVEKCFVASEGNLEKVLECEEHGKYRLPIIVFDKKSLVKCKESTSFGDGELDAFLEKGVSFSSPITSYFAFSASDPRSYIIYNVLFGAAYLGLRQGRFSLEELLRSIHQLWEEALSEDERTEIRAATGQTLQILQQRSNKHFAMRRVGQNEWVVETDKTDLNKLREMFKGIADEFEDRKEEDLAELFTRMREEQEAKTRGKDGEPAAQIS